MQKKLLSGRFAIVIRVAWIMLICFPKLTQGNNSIRGAPANGGFCYFRATVASALKTDGPWFWGIGTRHNSQHLIDPYFFSHVLHGVAFYYGLHLCWTTATGVQRFHAAIMIEAIWELLENSPLIINRYRTVTISLDYFGDSIANSMFGVLAALLGLFWP